jgi:hypothetical protein
MGIKKSKLNSTEIYNLLYEFKPDNNYCAFMVNVLSALGVKNRTIFSDH